MAQSTLSVRLDRADKESFEDFCRASGLNVSVALTLYVKSVIKNQRIPFEITGDPFYNPANLRRLHRSIADAEAGKLARHDLIEVEE